MKFLFQEYTVHPQSPSLRIHIFYEIAIFLVQLWSPNPSITKWNIVCYFNFVFSNFQGIEDGNLDAMDNTDLMDTDIPLEVPLPEHQFLSVSNSSFLIFLPSKPD